MSIGPTRDDARRLDAEDPLAPLRDRFVIEPGVVYFDGNSLGRLPRATADRLADVVGAEWGHGLVRSWEQWIDEPTTVGDQIGTALLGAQPGQVIVADTTTVNLYKLAHAALDLVPDRTTIMTDAGNFPTDRYVLEAVARARHGRVETVEGVGLDAITADTALVSFSLVDYRSGALADLAGITAAAHKAGAVVLWDLSHAVGAVEVALDEAEVDFAVGCTYKYVNAGPGAPAFAYVAARHHTHLHPVIPGWMGHADRFAMAPTYKPAPGVGRLLTGTPDPRGVAGVAGGVGLLAEAGMPAIRAKSLALTEMVIGCADAWMAGAVEVITPRTAARRGSHVALRHPDAWQVCQALLERHRVIADFREPDILRIGIAPIYTSYEETWIGVDAIRWVLERGEHRDFPAERRRVT